MYKSTFALIYAFPVANVPLQRKATTDNQETSFKHSRKALSTPERHEKGKCGTVIKSGWLMTDVSLSNAGKGRSNYNITVGRDKSLDVYSYILNKALWSIDIS